MTWTETGGDPMFNSAQLQRSGEGDVLKIFSNYRGGGAYIETFHLGPGEITKLSTDVDRDVELGRRY